MSRAVVLGAGVVGRAAAWDLARRGHDVTVADADAEVAAGVAGEFGLAPAALDVRDTAAVESLLASAEVVVSAVPYRFGADLAAAAVRTRTHYCDFGGNPGVVRRQLELDDRARVAGVSIVPDCGLAPGLANVLAVADVEAVEPGPVDRVILRVGALPAEPRGTLGYQLAFNPEGLLNEYDEPCDVLVDGRPAEVEPLTGFETVEIPGHGVFEAFHTAGGSSSLPRRFAGRVHDLDYKTLRHPGHGRVFAALRELGMFSRTPDASTGVAPRAALISALEASLPSGEPDVVYVLTEAARGEHRHRHVIVDTHDGEFSALARTTAFPATTLADRMVGGHVAAGVTTMDGAIGAGDLLDALADVGIVASVSAP